MYPSILPGIEKQVIITGLMRGSSFLTSLSLSQSPLPSLSLHFPFHLHHHLTSISFQQTSSLTPPSFHSPFFLPLSLLSLLSLTFSLSSLTLFHPSSLLLLYLSFPLSYPTLPHTLIPHPPFSHPLPPFPYLTFLHSLPPPFPSPNPSHPSLT